MDNDVILVNRFDLEIGSMEKLKAHQEGALHRAFSIFLFNDKGQMLMQRRALSKYHSPGLWTNTCCSHPAPGESLMNAASRRLKMEMGMKSVLEYQFEFYYKSGYENGLIEHEIDHVLFGVSEEQPLLNTEEACDWKYMSIEQVQNDLEINPENYTTWFRICLPKVVLAYEAKNITYLLPRFG
jgi:isopentenyl-diphosphate delta-isomerase